MRTTIEVSDEHRARLLELAARRGDKGFSGIVAEALEHYFQSEEEARERRRAALALRGCFTAEEAAALRDEVRKIRGLWR